MSRRISVTEHIVFDGHEGWEHDGGVYRLACGATVTAAPNGDILCHWLSGGDKEPATDNCVLMARSSDGGTTWSEPWVVIPAGEDASSLTCVYPTDDGRLIALGAWWPSEKHYTVWRYFRMESHDSGATWSEPERMVIYDDRATVDLPITLSTGEHLHPASFFEERPKPLTGPCEKLAFAKTEEEALAIPPGEGSEPGKFGTHVHGCLTFLSRDGDVRNLEPGGEIRNRPLGLLEPSIVETSDGRIVMIMRAEWGGYLWRAESTDKGRTWTEAWQTDIPNPTTKLFLQKLPDGRIALLHNATGDGVGTRGSRDPLSIWISDDDLESWSIKEDVITGGQLAYPSGMIYHDKLVFSYDHNRRQARFVEVNID